VGVTIKKTGTGTVTFTATPQPERKGSVSGFVVPSDGPPADPNLQSNVAPTPADAGVTVAVNVHFNTLPEPTCVTLQSAVLAAVGVTVKFALGATVVVVVEAEVVVVETDVVVVVATLVVVVVGVVVVVVGDDVVVVGELVVVLGELVVVVDEPATLVVVVDAGTVVVVAAEVVVVVGGGGDVLLSHEATSAHAHATANAMSSRLRRSIQHLCDSG
jgi:hypothetical protein